jgi:hypothetical protein
VALGGLRSIYVALGGLRCSLRFGFRFRCRFKFKCRSRFKCRYRFRGLGSGV